MKLSLTKLNKLLQSQGYHALRKHWYSDGLLSVSSSRPTERDARPAMWEPVWETRKKANNCVYFIRCSLSDDGGPAYWVLELSCYSDKKPRLHDRTGFRGPHLRCQVAEITENDLHNLSKFEIFLKEISEHQFTMAKNQDTRKQTTKRKL